MKIVQFSVPGEPHGKARPRVARDRYGRAHTYTPSSTVQYEELVKLSYLRGANHNFPAGEELAVSITAFFGVPKSTSKRLRNQMLLGMIRPTKKPDIDNICKSILDALNDVAYHDDTQVVELRMAKYYSEEPRVEVKIQKIGVQ